MDPDHAWIDPKHPERSKYTDSYRTTACFLDYLVRRYDPKIVKKFNRLLRRGGVTESEIEATVGGDEDVAAAQRRSIGELFQTFLEEWKQPYEDPRPAPQSAGAANRGASGWPARSSSRLAVNGTL